MFLPKDIGRQYGELVGALGVVEIPDDVLQDLVVDLETKRQAVRGLLPLLFLAEMEQPGVVSLVRSAEQFAQPLVDMEAIG
jgi:hypothetical protein